MGRQFALPVMVIIVGIAWLLNVMGIIPPIDWLWTCSIAAIGILTLLLGGITKVTVVVGPFMMIASVSSVLRQTGRIDIDKEVPILVIILGILMFISHFVKSSNQEKPEPEDAKK